MRIVVHMNIFFPNYVPICNFLFLFLSLSLQLADLVADEHRKLYAVFSSEEMQKFLRLMRDSSLLSLRTSGQPLPY